MSYRDFKTKLNQILTGWINYFYLADCKYYLQKMDAWIRRRIRNLYWRRWKRVRTRYRNLRYLGLSHEDALRGANMRVGPWRACNNPIINRALSNEVLAKWGFVSLFKTYWKIRKKKVAQIRMKQCSNGLK